ncbi:MAG: STAS domain-containing protein [Bacteroidota bacterium]
MKFRSEIKSNILILTLEGDLIGEDNGVELVDLINSHINNGVIHCVVNIAELRYINSSGIGVLITILTKFRNKGGEICLLSPSENVQKLLIITKLNNIFNILDSEEEAINILKK